MVIIMKGSEKSVFAFEIKEFYGTKRNFYRKACFGFKFK